MAVNETVGMQQVEEKLSALQKELKSVSLQIEALGGKVGSSLDASEDGEKTRKKVATESGMLSQQVSSIHTSLDAKLKQVLRLMDFLMLQNEASQKRTAEEMNKTIAESPKTEEIDYDKLADAIAKKMPSPKAEAIDYDKLADEVSRRITAPLSVDTDAIADIIADKVLVHLSKLEPAPASAIAAEVDTNAVASAVAEKLAPSMVVAPVAATQSEIDTDELVAKISAAIVIPEPVNVDEIVEKVSDKIAEKPVELDVASLCDAIAERIFIPEAEMPEINTEEMVKEIVAGIVIPEMDVEALAETISGKLELPEYNVDELSDAVAVKVVLPEINTEEIAENVVEKLTMPELTVDSKKIAEEILEILPEVDYDTLSDKLADKLGLEDEEEEEEELDEELIYNEIASRVAEKVGTPDYDIIAERVASHVVIPAVGVDNEAIATMVSQMIEVPEVDYETLATMVAEKVNAGDDDINVMLAGIQANDGEDTEKIVSTVTESGEKTNDLVREVIAILESRTSIAVAAVPVEETVEEEEEIEFEAPVHELVDEPIVEDDLVEPVEESAQEVVEETVEEIVEDPQEEPQEEATEETEEKEEAAAVGTEKTIRLKRSFECRMRQSDEDLKNYYGEIKNYLLSYSKVKSSVSWNGDRFNHGRDTVAKIIVKGKTLCLYLALDPDQYPVTKYHQKDASGLKAYEGTPMMIKIKSGMGVKKARTLIDDMLLALGSTLGELEDVDYVEVFAYKTDDEMIAEGLIKASLTEKKDLNSF